MILPDGSRISARPGDRIVDLIPRGAGLVARAGGRLFDLTLELGPGLRRVEVLGFDSPEGRSVYWHTTSHVMAQAVKRLFPEARLGVGPPTEEGFYYDFDLGGRTLSPGDLEEVEGEMARIVAEDLPIVREVLPRSEAVRLFEGLGEVYKVELLSEMEEEEVSIYRQGEFVDLCRGPHLPSTGYVKHFKLLGSSSAYWRGVETNPVMQRIYGISFPERSMLEEFLRRREEARRRDHRVLGPRLGLFSMPSGVIGPGLVVWHPRGAIARRLIEDFLVRVHLRRGYRLVYSPHIAYSRLWEISGHLDYYREYMYVFEKEGVGHVVKPMNCPFHILVYKSRRRSYRELPIRYFELGTVYRYERSGVLHGLMRVRGFTQDDAHIFCAPEQLREEVLGALSLGEEILSAFGFREFGVELSVWDPDRPEMYMGSPEDWEAAQEALASALDEKGYSYRVMPGEAAFYGPKIDVKLIDSIGREWQCSTIQVDFNLPRRFDVTYVDRDGSERTVVMIHRALLGSIERFFGILLEHYAGDLPLWLSPVQVRILPIADRHLGYAREVLSLLEAAGVRAEVDASRNTLGYKVREAELEKIPVVFVVGDEEVRSSTVSVRVRRSGDLGRMTLEEFLERFSAELSPPA